MSRPPARRRAGGTRARPAAAPGRAAHASQPAERLQKVLAGLGVASRREAEGWIRAGRLTINGAPATLGARVGPFDKVHLDGRLVRARKSAASGGTFICHRSPGEPLSGAGAAPGGTALTERIPRRAGRRFVAVSPMPRIDGGLELVTADGELAAHLQRAVHRLASAFGVRVRGELSAEQTEGVLGGVLDSGATLAVERCEAAGGEGANRWYTLHARGASGKEVRQLFERQGALVSRVLRTHLGPLTLERSLGRGQFRELTAEEMHALAAAAGAPEDEP